MSRDELARIIPVKPPIVNRKMNPVIQNITGLRLRYTP
jgi:hypothetical protein